MQIYPYPFLILASTSKYRSALLEKIKIPFETRNPEVDESILSGESPEETALRLSQMKSVAVAKSFSEGLVIGSDQVACIDGQTLGKPGNLERAKKQLLACSGRRVAFHTAITVTDAQSTQSISRLETTQVYFRELKLDQIVRYLEAEQPWDCAGSFKSEGLGIILFNRMEARDPNSLIGLPLMALVDILQEFKIDLP